MKKEPDFKVGEQVYYVDLDDDKFVIISCEITEVNKYGGIVVYGLHVDNNWDYPLDRYNIAEKNIFKADKKSFIEKLNLIFAEEGN